MYENFGGSTGFGGSAGFIPLFTPFISKEWGRLWLSKLLKRTHKCYQHPDLWGMASIFFSLPRGTTILRQHINWHFHNFNSCIRDNWSKMSQTSPEIFFLQLNILNYYSTNCNTIQIWSWCSRYLSSVDNRYPAVYVASYVGRKSQVKKCRQKDFKMLRALLSICWIIKQLSILLNLAEYRLILSDSAYDLVG